MVLADLSQNEATYRKSSLQRFLRIFWGRPLVKIGLIILLIFFIIAIFAPFIATHDPAAQDLSQKLANPSATYLLGTDNFGRDTFSRIIFGSRTSLIIGVLSTFIAGLVGMTAGLIAGYFGGWLYTVIMRIMDTLMAFPMLIFALLIAALIGGGIVNVIIALGIALIPGYARLMCGQVLSIKENDYIMAERAMGVSNIRIMFIHVFPNCIPALLIMVTAMIGMTILAEAGLSFLGIGIEPPTAAWGAMVSDGYEFLWTNPILSFAPGVAIMLVVFAFNMVGDGLRDALDPRLRGIL
jgi:ABC-type dipeptide/oligopeptide/nickel transport system permease subunit